MLVKYVHNFETKAMTMQMAVYLQVTNALLFCDDLVFVTKLDVSRLWQNHTQSQRQ
jgi:hypothetical protein